MSSAQCCFAALRMPRSSSSCDAVLQGGFDGSCMDHIDKGQNPIWPPCTYVRFPCMLCKGTAEQRSSCYYSPYTNQTKAHPSTIIPAELPSLFTKKVFPRKKTLRRSIVQQTAFFQGYCFYRLFFPQLLQSLLHTKLYRVQCYYYKIGKNTPDFFSLSRVYHVLLYLWRHLDRLLLL